MMLGLQRKMLVGCYFLKGWGWNPLICTTSTSAFFDEGVLLVYRVDEHVYWVSTAEFAVNKSRKKYIAEVEMAHIQVDSIHIQVAAERRI